MARRNTHTHHWQRYPIEKQQTQPLPTGNLAFRSYLSTHHLTSLAVARLADVPYAITWNIEHNTPIRSHSAALVRAALLRATGIAYVGPIIVHPEAYATTQERRDHETL